MAETQANPTGPAPASPPPNALDKKSAPALQRPPGLEAADNPEWSMRFLAQVYLKASKSKEVVEDIPNWFYPRPEVDLSGAVSYPHNQDRDRVLEEVVKELVTNKKLSGDAARTANDRWLLYRKCFTTGTVVIEGRSAYQFAKNTLPTAIRNTLNLLETAEPLWLPLHRTALLVVDRFTTMQATRRDPDLEAVLYPKNFRLRDGEPSRRIDRVRYIQAIRSFRLEASLEIAPAMNVKPVLDARGLTNAPLNRGTESPNRVDRQNQLKSVRPALNFLQRIAWHPDIAEFINALKASSELGKQKLTAMVIESIADAGKLADRILDDTRRVWRFSAALRAGIATIDNLTATERTALTLYAIAIAKGIKTSLEEALEAVGLMITILELFGGPIALVAIVADAIVQSAGAAVSFMREIDKDRAESASVFQKEADRLSPGGRYLEPAGQAIGALLAAAAVPGALSAIAREAKIAGKVVEATESIPSSLKAADAVAAKTAEEQGINNSIKAAGSEEQDIQRALGKAPSEKVATHPPKQSTAGSGAPETSKARAVEGKAFTEAASTSQSLKEQLLSVERQIDELHDSPDVPALQRELEYVRFWAAKDRESEAQKLLKSLESRVETAQLSRERGVFEPVYEAPEASPDARPESGTLRIQDRPPGVTKGESELWARVRASRVDPKKYPPPDVTGFVNPVGDRLKIDPNFKPPDGEGLTNRELTRQGKNPYLSNGDMVQLHHRDQDPFGILDETSTSFHQSGGPELHPEELDPAWVSWREYRAVFEGKERYLNDIYNILRERYWMSRFK